MRSWIRADVPRREVSRKSDAGRRKRRRPVLVTGTTGRTDDTSVPTIAAATAGTTTSSTLIAWNVSEGWGRLNGF